MNIYHNLQGEKKDQSLITCDKKGNVTGRACRQKCHSGYGITHLAFMAFIIDQDHKIILAKRSLKKSLWANFWDASVVSHILDGETAQSAAQRRGKEEMGINMEFEVRGAFYYFAKHENSSENEYCFVLTGKSREIVHPNPVEISQIQKIDAEKLEKLLNTNKNQFTPWLQIAWNKFTILNLL